MVHLSAVSATTTIAYFNLAGYFIGSELQGLTGGLYQALDTLCLQVTAKLLELLIVSSLGIILMDILRHQLLSGPEGLPLGILASKQQFTDMQYLISPEFRFGLAGFAHRRKRLLFGLFILPSSLISLFGGPSAALLLIPTQRSNWPAGGASFWLAGDDESLWPSKLTASSLGDSDCEYTSMQRLSTEALNSSACVWAGYSSLAEAFKQRHFADEVDLIVDDGVLKRDFVIRSKGEVAETWVLAIHMAVGVLSKNVAAAWYDALKGIAPSSWHYTLRYRIFNQTTGSVQSWVPVVRADCAVTDSLFWNSSGSQLEYPDLPEYGFRLDLNYWIETEFLVSSNISAQWITVPEVARLSDNSNTTDVPSAFLSVQIPYSGSNNTGTAFTCSIDARWAMGTYTGGPVGDIDADYVQTATIQNTRPFPDIKGYQYNFLPIDDGSWRRVQIDLDWLNTLTPPLGNSTSGWTSLAALLTDIGMDKSTGTIFDWVDVSSVLESIIATLVADGMSRQGYAANGGSSTHFSDALYQLPWYNTPSSQQSLLAGTYAFPPSAGTATQLRWSVVVGGYAYRADRPRVLPRADGALPARGIRALPRGILALDPRLLRRMGLVCRSRRPGRQVGARPGLPAPSVSFENAATGIERYRTMCTHVRVRASRAPGVTRCESGGRWDSLRRQYARGGVSRAGN